MVDKLCQYNKSNCQRTASYFHVRKLDLWELQISPVCVNCKKVIENLLKESYE